jgi:hypothetical protein
MDRAIDLRNPYHNYGPYVVTWSEPGLLTLGGDCGSLVLSHKSAMQDWVSAAQWIHRNADWHYLLTKSDAKPEYDPQETAAAIFRNLVADAVIAMKGHRDNLRSWREERAAGGQDFEANNPKPRLEVSLEMLRDGRWRAATEKERNHAWHLWQEGNERARAEAPSGFEGWLALSRGLDQTFHPDDIFVAKERREMRYWTESLLEDGEGAAAQLSMDVLNDTVVVRNYPRHCLVQIAALRRWAAAALQAEGLLPPDKVEATAETVEMAVG